MNFQTGKGGIATIGSFALPIVTWKVHDTSTPLVFRNSRSGGLPLREGAQHDMEVELTFEFDFDANPIASSPGIRAGNTFTNVTLPLRSGGSPAWNFPSLVAQRVMQQMNEQGRIAVTVIASINGAFSYPA